MDREWAFKGERKGQTRKQSETGKEVGALRGKKQEMQFKFLVPAGQHFKFPKLWHSSRPAVD